MAFRDHIGNENEKLRADLERAAREIKELQSKLEFAAGRNARLETRLLLKSLAHMDFLSPVLFCLMVGISIVALGSLMSLIKAAVQP